MVKAAIFQIETLNPKEIPAFLSHLSVTKTPEKNFNRKHNLFILNSLIRFHGRNITPYINPIMSTLIQCLQSNHIHSNFAFHGLCSQLVLQIAELGIDFTLPERENVNFLTDLCTPLSDSLTSMQKNAASVCAFCLRAIVESDKWKYASSELVNKICLEVIGAIREETERTGNTSGTHLRLAMSLAKQNPLIVEKYAKSLIKSGLFFLINSGPQAKLLSLEMIHLIVKCVDMSAYYSELGNVVDVLRNFANDRLVVVSGDAVEVLETIYTVAARRGFVLEDRLCSDTKMIVEKLGVCCVMDDRCDECMFENSSNQLRQRIRPHNSADDPRALSSSPECSYSTTNQERQNQFLLSSNFLQRQKPFISPESQCEEVRRGSSSETAMKKIACGGEERGFRVLDLVSGCLEFIFCYVFGEK